MLRFMFALQEDGAFPNGLAYNCTHCEGAWLLRLTLESFVREFARFRVRSASLALGMALAA